MKKSTEKENVRKVARYRNPRRYRLEFIKENTFNRIWSVRMTRLRVMVATVAFFAAVSALVFVILAFTPVGRILPGGASRDEKLQYMDAMVRLDSLERVVNRNNAYVKNIKSVLAGEGETVAIPAVNVAVPDSSISYPLDSLLWASEAERLFVSRLEAENKYNLSVLAPIAAEGINFDSPFGNHLTAQIVEDNGKLTVASDVRMPVNAVYRGTVVGVYTGPNGDAVVAIQHPNDFFSLYSGLGDVFVEKGSKVAVGQRIGHSRTDLLVGFELWHKGVALNPREYIP